MPESSCLRLFVVHIHVHVCIMRRDHGQLSTTVFSDDYTIVCPMQIRSVLDQCSAQPLLAGDNPGPLMELNFWAARCIDLGSIVEQVRRKFNIHTCSYIRCWQMFMINKPGILGT